MRNAVAGPLSALLLLAPSAAVATTWQVPSQCPTIEAGIDSAGPGDTVLVACGTYYEHDIAMKSGICLRSETGEADCVTIDAESEGRVLLCENASDTVRVEGITLAHGSADKGGGLYCSNSLLALVDCGFSENSASGGAWSGLGGALHCDSCSVVLTGCVFWANMVCSSKRDAAWGGAIYSSRSSLVLVGCSLSNNIASGWYPDAGLGGGLYAQGSCLVLFDCDIRRNAGVNGGGMYCEGDCTTTLTGCTLSQNSAYGYDILDGCGGGMVVGRPLSSTALANCSFDGNTATGFGGGLVGAAEAADCTFSSNEACWGGGVGGGGSFTHCVFHGNLAADGGGILCDVSGSEIINCTFCGNEGDGSSLWCGPDPPLIGNSVFGFGAGRAIATMCPWCEGCPQLTCCDIYANAGGDWVGCIAGYEGVYGNFSTDPLFCDPDSGDFHLDARSPCAPRQAGSCGLIGAFGAACSRFPPDLALGILQNPYLTQYLDVYLIASETVDSASVTLQVAEDTVSAREIDPVDNVWMGDYELTRSADSIAIHACAADPAGHDTCLTAVFSCTHVSAKSGGVVASPDGRMHLAIGPDVLNQDAYVLVFPGDDGQSDRPGLPSVAGDVTRIARPVGGATSYRISPAGILAGHPASVEFSYLGTDLEDAPPDRISIEQDGSGSLATFVDPEKGTVTGAITELGTFRLALGAAGSSRIVDPTFLRVEQNFPNPFNPVTTLRFEIRDDQRVRISVYDVTGREVTRRWDRMTYPGVHELVWDGESDTGQPVAPGMYFCRVETAHAVSTQKMLLVR